MQGSTPNKTHKKRKNKGEPNTDSPLKRRKGAEKPNPDFPMSIPKRPKKIREPKRNKEFQNNKAQKDVIELLDVGSTDLRWCYEVCKGQSNFQRAVVDLEKEERAH